MTGGGLIFSSRPLRDPRLWRLSLPEGELERLPGASEGFGALSVSAKTGRLVYENARSEMNIWSVDFHDGEQQSHPLIESTRMDTAPEFSTDGRRIAFISTRTGASEIWIAQADGSEVRRLTWLNKVEIGGPCWSPDDRRIAFTVLNEDQSFIHVMDSQGGRDLRLTDGGARDVVSSWSRDGDWLYFNSDRGGRWNVWKLPATGGEPLQVTSDGGLTARETMDGESIYFVKVGNPGIWRLKLADGTEDCVATYYSAGDCANWCILEDGLSFATYSRQGPILATCDLRGEGARFLAQLPGISMGSLCGLPDGSRYLYARHHNIQTDLMMVETLP